MSEPKILRYTDIKSKVFASGVDERILLDKSTPTDDIYQSVAIFEPWKDSGMHRHNAEESLFVLSGHGKVLIGSEEYEIDSGTCIYFPANTPHNFINTGKEKLQILVTFVRNDYTTTWL